MKRHILAGLAGLVLTCPVHADSPSLQDLGKALQASPTVTIYRAKEVVTLDPDRPTAAAVAVVGDRILGTGTVEELKKAIGEQPSTVDDRFADWVIVPGFVAQHDHPLLAALTMTTEIIAIEDWVLPSGVRPAAKNREDYLKKLAEANQRLTKPDEVLVTWGYHQYFHGALTKADLDAISATRPIIVWHRSAHEFYLNSAAARRYGVTAEWFAKQSDSAKAQARFDNLHFFEQGAFAVMPLIGGAIAAPARLKAGLEFVETYFHANGVTVGCEPGGLVNKALQDAQNEVLSDAATPFRWYFIADGKSLTGVHGDDVVIGETAKLLSWGSGRTAYLPQQVKLFADGAIFSQAMQLSKPYADGHKGEWMMDLPFFQRTFKVYWEADYQIHVHVNGDAGLDMVLDTLELNMRRRPRFDHRTVIVHFAVSRPDQVERIRRLGAIVSGNSYYPVALADNYRTNGLDPERADPMVRMGDVEKAGISYSFHSDMPMAPGQPLLLMHCGVNRITNDGNLRAPDQRVSRLGALRAVTLDAAYSLQLEEQIGSIVMGKLANFTILAENPVTCDPLRLKDVKVWGTVSEGRLQPVASTVASGPARDASGMRAAHDAMRFDHEHGHDGGCTCTTAKALAELAYLTAIKK